MFKESSTWEQLLPFLCALYGWCRDSRSHVRSWLIKHLL